LPRFVSVPLFTIFPPTSRCRPPLRSNISTDPSQPPAKTLSLRCRFPAADLVQPHFRSVSCRSSIGPVPVALRVTCNDPAPPPLAPPRTPRTPPAGTTLSSHPRR
jgi:hypothetical protein